MPRSTPSAHWLLLPFVMAIMLLVYLFEISRHRELQAPVPVTTPDVWGDVIREVQRRPWVDPMQPRDNSMPGGLK